VLVVVSVVAQIDPAHKRQQRARVGGTLHVGNRRVDDHGLLVVGEEAANQEPPHEAHGLVGVSVKWIRKCG
jgi:hypothetical protein